MIKKFSLSIFFIAIFLSLAFPVFAGEVRPCPDSASSSFSNLCGRGLPQLGELVKKSVTILFIVAVIATLFFLIFGGIKWITSGGDKAKLEIARNTIVASIIGLVLVFSSYFILNITLEFFGLDSIGTFNIPTL